MDFKWHQKTLQPAAPEELYDRIITAHGAKGKGYLQGGLTVGGFLHDISRAASPHPTWPHPGTEWALAGGAADVVRVISAEPSLAAAILRYANSVAYAGLRDPQPLSHHYPCPGISTRSSSRAPTNGSPRTSISS